MEKIASFTIDHLNLLPGLYLSRRDEKDGVAVTTFDLRFTAPNREPAMDIAALHTVEHLFATCLRNSSAASEIIRKCLAEICSNISSSLIYMNAILTVIKTQR